MEDLGMFQVSVIMPLHNTEKYVKEAIESILLQSVLPIEVIVIDDCSTDASYEIVKELASTNNLIKLYRLSKNMGVSAARNYGINLARGHWILFLDADDVACPDLIEKLCGKLKFLNQLNGNKWLLVYSAFQQINSLGKLLGTLYSVQREWDEVLGYELIRNEIVSPSGVIVHRQTIIDVGGFDEKMKYSEDWDLWLKIAQCGGFGYINSPLVKIRRHNENASKKISVMMDAERNVLKKYDLLIIKEAIFKRKIAHEQNVIDFVSILFRLNEWELGKQALDELKINSNSFSTSLLFNKGLYYLNCEKLDRAKEYFESVLSLNPRHGAALNNLGVILAINNDLIKSKELFLLAISIYNGYIDAKQNYDIVNKISNGLLINLDIMRITWRELRDTLLIYRE